MNIEMLLSKGLNQMPGENAVNPFQTEGVLFENMLLGLKTPQSLEPKLDELFLNPEVSKGFEEGLEEVILPKKSSVLDLSVLNTSFSIPTSFGVNFTSAQAEVSAGGELKKLENNLGKLLAPNLSPQKEDNEFQEYDIQSFSIEARRSKEPESLSLLQTWSVLQPQSTVALNKTKGIENYSQIARLDQSPLNPAASEVLNSKSLEGNLGDSSESEAFDSAFVKKPPKSLQVSKEPLKSDSGEFTGVVTAENKPTWFQDQSFPAINEAQTVTPFKTSEVATQVQSLAAEGGGKIQVILNPPHLGQVEIQVSTKGKKVELGIRLEDANSKAMVENGLLDLKQALEIQDLQLSKVEILDGKDFASAKTNDSLFSEHGSSGQSSLFQGNESPRKSFLETRLVANRGSGEMTHSPVSSQPSIGRLNLKV